MQIDTIAQLVIILLIFVEGSAQVNSNLNLLALSIVHLSMDYLWGGENQPFSAFVFLRRHCHFQLEKFARI